MTVKTRTNNSAINYNTSHEATIACISYAITSTGVTIMNKLVFSHAHFHYPWFTLAFQNLISVLVISLARFFGYTRAGRLSPSLAKCMPFPIIYFVLFIFTNAQSLRHVNLPVLTVCKSLGPMFVTLFERFYFHDQFSTKVYLAMSLITLSAFVTAINDLEYSPIGYFWAIMNVFANVAYLASLRIFLKDPDISPLDKTFHSNLLSIIPIIPMSIISGEFPTVLNALSERSPIFKFAYFASGFLTTGVCASAFWTISLTNGSTLSFIGGFNKVPIILLSLFLFDMKISIPGWIGVSLGVIAGIIFIYAKQTISEDKERDFIQDEELQNAKLKLNFDEDYERDNTNQSWTEEIIYTTEKFVESLKRPFSFPFIFTSR